MTSTQLQNSPQIGELPISVDSTASLRELRNKLRMKTKLLSAFKRDISREILAAIKLLS